MLGVHGHDVLVAGNGPVRTKELAVRQMHRVVAPQPLKVMPHRVIKEEHGLGRIDLINRQAESLVSGGLLKVGESGHGLISVAIDCASVLAVRHRLGSALLSSHRTLT